MEYWLWLRLIKGLGPIMEKRLLNYFKTPKSIYEACADELMSVVGIGDVIAGNIVSSRSLDKAYSLLEEVEKKSIKLLTYNNPLYPSIAKEYAEAPTLLYYKGNIKENIEGVGVVGSRRCSSYGKQVTIEAVEFLAKNNIPVISGMAKGIDGYAHTACLKSGGYTIAFLGNGVDICYPSEHATLMEAIIENGAVVSEYPPGTKGRKEFFPKRNALISSWSKKILVIEAAEKSGALITADFAKELGREVLVPPHEIYSITGKGTNKLISQGNSLYLEPSQLLYKNKLTLVEREDDINLAKTVKDIIINNEQSIDINYDLLTIEKKILSCIIYKPKTIAEIGMELDIDQVDLIENISIMELEGKIVDISGGSYKGVCHPT